MSIFQSLRRSEANLSSFWKTANPRNRKFNPSKILFKDVLRFFYNSETLLPYETYLTDSKLFFILENTEIAYASVKWCLVESFSESSPKNESRFGFSLLFDNVSFDFYTKDAESLEVWVEKLSSISVMTDFESNYVILKSIDSGQFGTVFLCQHLFSPAQFAVKKIEKTLLQRPRTLHSLYNEISILRKLDHPSIMRLFKVYEAKLLFFWFWNTSRSATFSAALGLPRFLRPK
jgi:hypothetical protein